MIVGIGLDLVEVGRIAAFRERWGDRGLERLFTRGELRDCMDRAAPDPSLAARFAAKEAFFKALGTGYGRGGDWTDVEVRRDRYGAPSLHLSGRAEAMARDLEVARVKVSLSHTAGMAAAQVLLERD
jgi:holo-[acyl-carrier protein] synthase